MSDAQTNVKFSFNSELDDYFHFEVDKKVYRMRYPTTEEIQKVTTLNKDLQKILDKHKDSKKEAPQTDKDKVEKINKQIEGIIYSAVNPLDEDSPNIKKAIEKWSMRTQNQFYNALYGEYYSMGGESDEG